MERGRVQAGGGGLELADMEAGEYLEIELERRGMVGSFWDRAGSPLREPFVAERGPALHRPSTERTRFGRNHRAEIHGDRRCLSTDFCVRGFLPTLTWVGLHPKIAGL